MSDNDSSDFVIGGSVSGQPASTGAQVRALEVMPPLYDEPTPAGYQGITGETRNGVYQPRYNDDPGIVQVIRQKLAGMDVHQPADVARAWELKNAAKWRDEQIAAAFLVSTADVATIFAQHGFTQG